MNKFIFLITFNILILMILFARVNGDEQVDKLNRGQKFETERKFQFSESLLMSVEEKDLKDGKKVLTFRVPHKSLKEGEQLGGWDLFLDDGRITKLSKIYVTKTTTISSSKD